MQNSKDSLAPIVIFAYNRPLHTLNLIKSLIGCELSELSELFIFIDAAKTTTSLDEIEKSNEVISIAKKINHFKKVTTFINKENKGVDKSIIEGVTKIISKYGKAIILEDDLIVANSFLKYINWALNSYQNDERIFSVNGFMFPINFVTNRVQLLPFISSWGWATWKNRWEKFQFDDKNRNIINESSQLKERFNLSGINYSKMLIENKECWDINWYFYVFKNGGLNVFPPQTLVKNMGFDGSGVHCPSEEFMQNFDTHLEISLKFSNEIDLQFYDKFIDYFNNKKKSSPYNRTKKILRNLVNQFKK